MVRAPRTRVMVRRIDGEATTVAPDDVAGEEPMEIRLDDHLVTTTMRTPGHDFELAVGFCHGEGLLIGAPVLDVRYCATGSAVSTEFNVVTVGTGGRARAPEPRLVSTTASCGLCGSASIESLADRLSPLDAHAPVDTSLIAEVASRARDSQPLFAATGSVHAAAAFSLSDGELVALREDVGRHNAVDKVVGRMLLDGLLPAVGLGLFLSGRISFELVQKAWAAGFALVAAVGGPSDLAVETARQARLTLVGFVREDHMNVYAPEP